MRLAKKKANSDSASASVRMPKVTTSGTASCDCALAAFARSPGLSVVGAPALNLDRASSLARATSTSDRLAAGLTSLCVLGEWCAEVEAESV